MSHAHAPYDVVGVGVGPFNLSLAALADAVDGLNACFLEAKGELRWHPGLLIEGTQLQVPFLADLVSLVDPTSRWSFLSYLREHDRLFPFYFAERFHVPRREYDHYLRWVADSLESCHFGRRVDAVRLEPADRLFTVAYTEVATGRRSYVRARNVVLGVGTEPVVPPMCADLLGAEVIHSADYLDHADSLLAAEDVTVVGSGQSGAEVFADLLRARPEQRPRLRWISRSTFAPMEYSKLGLEHFTPDYARYFHGLPRGVKDRLVPAQWQLYKAISAETIAEIHDLLYEQGIGGRRVDADLLPNVALEDIWRSDGGYRLCCRQVEQDRRFAVATDRIVLATGYAPRPPAMLDSGLVDWDDRGRFRVDPDYRVALAPPAGRRLAGSLFVQNAELHTHGVGAPDLGLGAWRAATILNAICRRTAYRLPRRTAYTTFGSPGDEVAGRADTTDPAGNQSEGAA